MRALPALVLLAGALLALALCALPAEGSSSSSGNPTNSRECAALWSLCENNCAEGSSTLRQPGLCPGTSYCCIRDFGHLSKMLNGQSNAGQVRRFKYMRNRNVREKLFSSLDPAVGGGSARMKRNMKRVPVSPDDRLYSSRSRVGDSQVVNNYYKSGGAAAVLDKFTQFDNTRGTSSDPYRCGTAAVIAVAINSASPFINLENIALYIANTPGVPSRTVRSLRRTAQRAASKTLSFGDLGYMAEKMLQTFGTANNALPGAPLGMSSRDIYRALYEGAQIDPPSNLNGNPRTMFSAHQAWPIQLAINQDNQHDHWGVVGRTKEGVAFFYDPQPRDASPFVRSTSEPAYTKYLDNVRNHCSGCGFAASS